MDLWRAAVLADQIVANAEAFQFTGEVFQCAVQFTHLTARWAPHRQNHLTGCSWFWWPWPCPAPGSCSTTVTLFLSSLLSERSFVHKKGQYYKNPPYQCEPWRSWWFFDRCVPPAIARANKQYKLIVNKILENSIEKRHCEISIPRKMATVSLQTILAATRGSLDRPLTGPERTYRGNWIGEGLFGQRGQALGHFANHFNFLYYCDA